MQHILLTRFNVQYKGRPLPSESWLRHRLQLFEQYTAPSIQRQIAQPDRWLVFSHRTAPSWFQRALLQSLPVFGEVVWMDTEWSDGLAARLVADRINPGTNRLLTTRLDSDDAVSRDFVRVIQANCPAAFEGFLNLTHGAQLNNGRVYFRSDPSNPFVSCIENCGAGRPPHTVFIDWHTRLSRHGTVRQIRTHPTWLQVIHDANLDNAVRGIRVGARVVAPYFDIDLGILPVGRMELAFDVVRTGVRVVLRLARRPAKILKLLA